MTAVLEIRLFGGLEIRCEDAPIGGFISGKVPALLAYLAVTGRPHQRHTLAALFWGEMADADANNNLRQTLSNLRKVLDGTLLVTRDTVAWNPAVVHTLDTAQFEAHLRAGRDAPAAVRASAFQQAAALYHGDFLAGVFVRDAPEFEEWLLAQRIRYRELALHTLHTLTDHHLSRGEYGRAIDCATRLLALDAWREEAHRQLMLALARSGQRSAALAQYESCRRLLDAELGVPPSAETTALYERIRAAGDMPPHNLPPQPTRFVGRMEELAHIEELLQTPEVRLITVVGPGGIGKTRLALQAAAHAHRRGLFLHGVFFVPLEGIDSPLLLATTVAQAMGLQFSGSQEPADQLRVYLQTKEILLMLDNLEHLAGADAWAGRLVQACTRVTLLVTSRKRLNLHGERLLELSGLTAPLDEAGTDITGYSAAQLFLNSAQNVQPDFAVTRENEQVIGRICRLVNGLPLAIELAAAWVRHLNCHEIAAEIERNLGFLATTQANVPVRHRSLQATFEHSWALLDEDERRTFAHLALFRGGFDRSAALTITQCRFPILIALCDKSLLRRDPAGRYALHELLRQYAEVKLQAEAQTFAAAQARHGQYYLQFLAAREDAQNDARQQETQQEIAAEMDNIRAAWGWAIARQQPNALESALESLRVFFEHAGWYTEAIRLFEAAAACTTGTGADCRGPVHFSQRPAAVAGRGGALSAVPWQHGARGRRFPAGHPVRHPEPGAVSHGRKSAHHCGFAQYPGRGPRRTRRICRGAAIARRVSGAEAGNRRPARRGHLAGQRGLCGAGPGRLRQRQDL
jgi:predicted ATPase/DNA-binding SARP family transcriptional activator